MIDMIVFCVADGFGVGAGSIVKNLAEMWIHSDKAVLQPRTLRGLRCQVCVAGFLGEEPGTCLGHLQLSTHQSNSKLQSREISRSLESRRQWIAFFRTMSQVVTYHCLWLSKASPQNIEKNHWHSWFYLDLPQRAINIYEICKHISSIDHCKVT